jgi:Fur family ferric uptake transcriptional regulator
MAATAKPDWGAHALAALEGAGYRSSAPRTAVVETMANEGCGVSARELADRLSDRGIGQASIYRTLELLDQLRLVQRYDVGEGLARYEPVFPNGEHHHHVVCDRCGAVTQFEDDQLEQAIDRLSRRLDFTVDAHEVVLRGECPVCRARAR